MEKITNGVINGFMDINHQANIDYIPKILVNDTSRGEKVLVTITKELKKCKSFFFCVAFLTKSGVQVLLSTLNEIEEMDIRGTIIVSEYQYFTDPKALEQLMKYKNIELRIIKDGYNMHAKGYMFNYDNELTAIVGSSNLTQSALTTNKEWNVKLITSKTSSYYKNITQEFNEMLKNSIEVTQEYIAHYKTVYKNNKIRTITKEDCDVIFQPNKMQVNALKRIQESRNMGNDKALIISSTGTGKTILSALDVKAFNPRKFLFIIHREQIANDALNAYKKVLGQNINTAILSGGNRKDADYIFATIQTLSKDNVLNTFNHDEFDYIVFDEVHRIGAPSYQKVYNYFKPKFVLGMTATPERSDGLDIYKFFDYNIAYEIRLQEAMEENLISPFHYYGVSELVIEGNVITDKENFNNLISENRVNHIIDKIELYGYCGNRVKGLIFVSRKDEAIKLSELFNQRGYRTVSLTGEDSQTKREECVAMLEQDSWNQGLDYIFTVDIFNEGIDIPAVNQIVMLRPTESSIIFIQQLGRGLRKYKNKEYVVVIDFIGNYEKNFLIPIALSGDNTYNKDNIRRFIQEGNNIIPGASTINFEKIVKERIFESIDKANFSDTKLIKESYFNLKAKLGKIPSLKDFSNFGAIDIMRIIAKYDSYYNFLKKFDTDYLVELSNEENLYIDFITSKYLSGKRPHELELIKCIINGGDIWGNFIHVMNHKYPNLLIDQNTKINLLNQMTQKFIAGNAALKYQDAKLIQINGEDIAINDIFNGCLDNDDFGVVLHEIIDYGLVRNELLFGERYKNSSFKLYEKYTYDDVFRLLDWQKSEVSLNVGGYKYETVTNTFPVFINYNKDEDISDTVKYEDHFISPNLLKAISKGGRTLSSPEIVALKNGVSNGMKIDLFVRRNKDDKTSKEFYYLGEIKPTNQFNEFTMVNTNKTAVEIGYKLEEAVREDIYDFLIS